MLAPYDSPTFLGRQSKLLWGLSFMQVLVATLIGFFWLLVVASGPGEGFLVKLLIYVPSYLISAGLLMYRIRGSTLPRYVMLVVMLQVRSRMFESSASEFVYGLSEWRESREVETHAAGGSLAAELRGVQRHAESQARVERLANAAALGMKRFAMQVIGLISGGRIRG